MPCLNWFDQHSGAVQAIATIAYVLVSIGLWIATWLNARRTKELARESAEALKVQIVATYFQVRAAAAADPDSYRGYLIRRPISTRELQQLFEKVIPGLWAELDPILFPPAEEPQQHSPNAGTAPRQQSPEEELP
jgi:hypothetical protein